MSSGFSSIASVIGELNLPGMEGRLFIKRDDLIHPIVSGNKWRKLKFVIDRAKLVGKSHLVTFGGAYSNHMVATACAGAVLGMKTSCFLRADEDINNHYLQCARLYGMELIPTSRESYRNKKALYELHFGGNEQTYFVGEGGESEEAKSGVSEIITELDNEPDFIVHASATATTAAGLARGIIQRGWKTTILAVTVLKNAEEQRQKLKEQGLENVVQVIDDFNFGGYAKTNAELMDFIKSFIAKTGIMIDPVYTGKALYALEKIKPGGNVLFLHTGGTLGIFSDRFLQTKL